ncbi:putative 2-aminoethylphosphonate transport system permease protein PhnV [bacterium BMS3Abin05]|nr:putative 2-aminoethylphosphonate transport system permease protein PhnV [bacterium BMS3Abin05]
MRVKRAVLIFTVFLLVIIGLLPVAAMLIKSVMVNGHLSLSSYSGLFFSSHSRNLMGHSLVLSLWVTLLTTIIGLPLGILFAKTNLPFRRVFAVLFTIPLLIPPYINAISWFDLLGRGGIMARLLGPAWAKTTSSWLFGLPGCVLVLFSVFMPIVMLLTMTYLKTIDPRLEEAGRLVSRWPKVLREITVPLILPSVLLAAVLVFLLTFGEFGVPNFLRYDVYAVESFIQFSASYNFGAATAAAVPLAVVTLLVLLAERVFLRERTYQIRPSPGRSGWLVIKLGSLRKWLFVLVAAVCFVTVIVPILVLVIRSAHISTYRAALEKAGDSILRSLSYAAIGASLLTLVGFLSGYLIYNRLLPFWRSVDSLTLFLFALPGTVIGIGLISFWNRPLTNFIYATPAIIIIGYIAKYTVLTSRITVSQLAQIPASMEEAAQMVGAGWLRRMRVIIIPLARRGLLAGWLVGYIFSLRDTEITMMVYPPGHDTLPVRIFTLMANGSPQLIAALCVILISVSLLPIGIFWMIYKFTVRTGME